LQISENLHKPTLGSSDSVADRNILKKTIGGQVKKLVHLKGSLVLPHSFAGESGKEGSAMRSSGDDCCPDNY